MRQRHGEGENAPNWCQTRQLLSIWGWAPGRYLQEVQAEAVLLYRGIRSQSLISDPQAFVRYDQIEWRFAGFVFGGDNRKSHLI